MTKKIYLETFEKYAGSLSFPLLENIAKFWRVKKQTQTMDRQN